MFILIAIIVTVTLIIYWYYSRPITITDTNIWYSIESKSLPWYKYVKYRLIANYVNIDELSITKKLKNNDGFEQIKRVTQTLYKKQYDIIVENPISYLIKLETPEANLSKYFPNYQGIIQFTQDLVTGKIDFSKISLVEDIIDDRKEELRTAAHTFNSDMLGGRNEVQSKIKQGIYAEEEVRDADTLQYTKEFIAYLVRSITAGQHRISTNFPWEKVELFLYTLDAYRKEYALGEKSFKPNDWYDLFVLVYVSPSQKYWTEEKSWRTHIKNAGMEKYLIELDYLPDE